MRRMTSTTRTSSHLITELPRVSMMPSEAMLLQGFIGINRAIVKSTESKYFALSENISAGAGLVESQM